MNQKIALIIGGTGGIGSVIAKAFLKRGDKVCVTYRDKSSAEKIFSEYSASPDLFMYAMDLAEPDSIHKAVERVVHEHDAVDVIIYAPTMEVRHAPIVNLEWERCEEQLHIQVRGLFCVVKKLLAPSQRKRKMKFIIISSDYTIGKPPAGIADYVMAKYALMGLAKAMAVECVKYNMTFNIVSPGMTDTDLLSALPSKVVEIAALNNPLKRIAKPEDVSNAVLFLAEDASDYLNGVNITINGGGTML